MELKIINEQKIDKIQFNYEELKNEITEKSKLYKNMVYTDETIKEAKSDKAKLNSFIKVLEDERKKVKKQCLEPYQEFEKQIKDLVSIINEPVALITTQVEEFDIREKDKKIAEIKELWETKEKPEWLLCSSIWNSKWVNKTFSMKKVEEEINEKIALIQEDIQTIISLDDFSFEAMDNYKKTLDLSKAIAEGQRLVEIQRRKEEQEKQRLEEVKNVEEVRNWIEFKALLSNEQAQALARFCKENNIEIKPL